MWRRYRGDGGASLVEFALVLPLLALFLFGIVQFGLAYDQKQSINSAAREGARSAAIPDASVDYDAIVARVNASFDSLSADTVDSVTIEIVDATDGTTVLRTVNQGDTDSPCENHPGETVRVTAVNNFAGTIPFFGELNRNLTGTGDFRCEIDA